ncbi:hypothetical protein QVD17_36118 [Tagetes erecta]|uniref:Uncharacterized protein n=1 Tax=Tagetes erecta TaxID=13708 RepID=A0AAD8NIQ6_TARER|nr:hypothetical protein QVD17_36118 [Tagetes erecta]
MITLRSSPKQDGKKKHRKNKKKSVIVTDSTNVKSDLESRIHAVKPLWDQTLTMITNLHKAASTTDRTHTHTHCTST